jgi:UDP-N-acetylglucosamine--N-acetylmuramyl-(pentapeptide) pyrophosphoryl-undecaprenol N-acetylglucosamine transferase
MSAAEFVFAGGGTGGHLFPGLAVADALVRRDPDARITFFTTTRPLDRQLLEPTDYRQVEQPVRPFTLHPLRLPGFWWNWRKSVQAARAYLRQSRPRAVLGLGGYAAGPAVVAARGLGIRTAILNPDAIPGRANRYLARHADLVILQWDVSRRHFPQGVNCRTLGCPIRAGFAGADPAAGRRHFELDPDRLVLLVTGASQGARTLNQAMIRVWPAFRADHPDWQLLHVTGPADQAETRAAYSAANCSAQVVGFTPQMPLAIAAADLVVSRAGASTLAELTALGKPSILLPYPYHRDRHQHANAQVLVDQGAAVMLEDRLAPELNEHPLRAALDRLADSTVRQGMAQAALSLGRCSAADEVARWLLT